MCSVSEINRSRTLCEKVHEPLIDCQLVVERQVVDNMEDLIARAKRLLNATTISAICPKLSTQLTEMAMLYENISLINDSEWSLSDSLTPTASVHVRPIGCYLYPSCQQ